jgi:glucans biosynthesis protein C
MTRYYGIDALRGGVMSISILHHAAFFIIINDLLTGTTPSVGLSFFTELLHHFRMPLFFLLAGFSAAALVTGRGLKAAAQNRARRVLIPFLLSIVTILPLTLWAYLSAASTSLSGHVAFLTTFDDLRDVTQRLSQWGVTTLSLMHLWFLHYLLALYLLAPLLDWVVRSVKTRIREAVLQRVFASGWMLVPLALITAATLFPFPGAWFAVDDTSVVPNLPELTHYALFFTLGYAFWHFPQVLETCRRYWFLFGVLAIGTFMSLDFAPRLGVVSPIGARIVLGIATSLSIWAFLYFLMGCSLRYLDFDHKATRVLSRSSYWIYLVHVPAVFLIGTLLAALQLGRATQFLLLSVLTAVVCYASYWILVRRTWLDALLRMRSAQARLIPGAVEHHVARQRSSI